MANKISAKENGAKKGAVLHMYHKENWTQWK